MDCKLHRKEKHPTTLKVHVTKDKSISRPVNVGDVCARDFQTCKCRAVCERAII